MKFIIPGTLPSLNEYINAERSNRYQAANMKKEAERRIGLYAQAQLTRRIEANVPVIMHYLWVEPNNRRDADNIAFAKKFVQDALVKSGLLVDDSRKHVIGFTDAFATDKNFPRIEVEIEEVGTA